mgnify:CR=1 FL=1
MYLRYLDEIQKPETKAQHLNPLNCLFKSLHYFHQIQTLGKDMKMHQNLWLVGIITRRTQQESEKYKKGKRKHE